MGLRLQRDDGGTDLSCWTLRDLRCSTGRSDGATTTEAGTLTATLTADDVTVHGNLSLGNVISLWETDSRDQPLWRIWGPGVVTDLDAELTDSGNPRWRTRLQAAGLLSYLSRVYVGDSTQDWPQETDVARIARILTLCNLDTSGIPVGVQGPTLLAISKQAAEWEPALNPLSEAAIAGGGLLWENSADARIDYLPRLYRQRPDASDTWDLAAGDWDSQPGTWVPAATVTWDDSAPWDSDHGWDGDTFDPLNTVWELDPCAVLAEPLRWFQRIRMKITYCRISFGSPQRTVEAGAHVPGQPIWDRSFELPLANESDAQETADRIVSSSANPGWTLGNVVLAYDLLTEEQRSMMRGLLRCGQFIRLVTPPGSPASPFEGFLEGWQHTLSEDRWETALYISDWTATVAATRWSDSTAQWDAATGDWNSYQEVGA